MLLLNSLRFCHVLQTLQSIILALSKRLSLISCLVNSWLDINMTKIYTNPSFLFPSRIQYFQRDSSKKTKRIFGAVLWLDIMLTIISNTSNWQINLFQRQQQQIWVSYNLLILWHYYVVVFASILRECGHAPPGEVIKALPPFGR